MSRREFIMLIGERRPQVSSGAPGKPPQDRQVPIRRRTASHFAYVSAQP